MEIRFQIPGGKITAELGTFTEIWLMAIETKAKPSRAFQELRNLDTPKIVPEKDNWWLY